MNGEINGSLELWALIAVNFLGFFLGSVITVVSYWAYRSHDQKRSLWNATAGFGLLTVGSAVEPAYQLGIAGPYFPMTEETVYIQITEGTLISLGFLVLFFSIYKYGSRSKRQTVTVSGVDDDLFENSD